MLANIDALKRTARNVRADALCMVHRAHASHIGGCLSAADIITALYWHTLRVSPETLKSPARDRFLLSKGHAAAVLYAALAERGFFPREELAEYCQNGSRLIGHVSHEVPGVEASSGSLGHGLPIACGLALAAKRLGSQARSFVLIGDGELDEGSNWEAILFAPQHRLDNLTLIIDYNKIQSYGSVHDVMELDPLSEKLSSFRWAVREIDGHDMQAIVEAFDALPFREGMPSALVAHTIKGKGVSFMENNLLWHYRSPNDEELAEALREVRGDS